MATPKPETLGSKDGIYREEWPRIRTVTVRGVEFFQCDGRPHYQRKIFSSLVEARKQANTWENSRIKYGKAGSYISERDATRVAEALDLLKPHGASIVDAARHFAGYLEAEKLRASGKPVADALAEWLASYDGKERDESTKREIASKVRIFGRAFGKLKLSDLTADILIAWIDGYEAEPGKPASPQTRASLRTKLSQFLNFSKLKRWIENNPLDGITIERPPRSVVAIFDANQAKRLIEAADKSEQRAIVLPYALVCLFAGLRPASEAIRLEWRDISFSTGDLHVRATTSRKTKEERFVPMEVNLIAWLETCPIREPGPIIGKSNQRFRMAWEDVKRAIGYKVGDVPEGGWPATALDWPVDITRHTYASMWLATHKSRSELAERMGNSETEIKKRYRRAIRDDVAKAFWAIMPKASKGGKILRMEAMA